MPTYATNTVRDDFRRIYPDTTEAEALSLLNATRNEVLSNFPLVLDTVDVTPLTAGTASYNLESLNILRVWGAAYVTAAGTASQLERADYYDQILRDSTFLIPTTQGTPERFYITSNDGGTSGLSLGLYPRPDTSTGATYPYVRLYATTYETLTAGSSFYDDIPSSEVYVMGMAMRWARRRRRDQAEFYSQQFAIEMAKLQEFFKVKQDAKIQLPLLKP